MAESQTTQTIVDESELSDIVQSRTSAAEPGCTEACSNYEGQMLYLASLRDEPKFGIHSSKQPLSAAQISFRKRKNEISLMQPKECRMCPMGYLEELMQALNASALHVILDEKGRPVATFDYNTKRYELSTGGIRVLGGYNARGKFMPATEGNNRINLPDAAHFAAYLTGRQFSEINGQK